MKNSFVGGFRWVLVAGLLATLGSQAKDPSLDVAGKWSWSVAARGDGETRKTVLNLKVDGEKVTGKVVTPGRDGKERETEIEDGKITGSDVSFNVTREYNGNKMVAKYSGKIAGDKITGKVATNRNGQDQSRDWEATRVVEKNEKSDKGDKK